MAVGLLGFFFKEGDKIKSVKEEYIYQVQCNECHKSDAESLSGEINYKKLHEGDSNSILTIKWKVQWGGKKMFLDKRIIVKTRLIRWKIRDIFGKSGKDNFFLVYRTRIRL